MNDELHIPQIANDRKPEIGMKFASINDAFEFYNQYARVAGFSARISNSKKNKMNEVVWKQFVCFKAGQTDEVRSKNRASSGGPIKKRAHGEVRTGWVRASATLIVNGSARRAMSKLVWQVARHRETCTLLLGGDVHLRTC
ncbi:hypothetical protein SASPL_107092 [Salvia splendens]|uniref:FAR1 domain-containing protein n=1 Tax=Salvia splendens TaxID=180675 RepID=A0A8X8YAR8_SALSN|nr:hypothetical protein SASPL_107092 [Salvia splendens]